MNYKRVIIGTLSWRRLVSSILIIYFFTALFAHFYAEKLIFPYNESSYDKTVSGFEYLKTDDGIKIATRLWQVQDEKGLILFFHGNYMDIGHLDDVAELFNQYGYSILTMDYRGYGLSQGKPKEYNTYLDAHMLYKYSQNLGYKDEDIILLGQSVGSGIATELARHHKAKLLVLISPFTSTYRVITKYPILPFDKFNNLAKINEIETPLFIIHGAEDNIIPSWHSQKIINKHTGKHKRILIDGAGHNDIWYYLDDNFIKQLDVFVNFTK